MFVSVQVLSEDLALAYVAMGIWAATITHFTIGTELLKLTPEEQEQQQQHQQQLEGEQRHQTLLLGAGDSKLGLGRAATKLAAGPPAGPSSTDGEAASCVVELGRMRGQQQQQGEEEQLEGHGTGLAGLQREGHGSQASLRSMHGSADCLVLAAPKAVGKGACASCGTDMPAAAGATDWSCPLCGTHNKAAAALQQQQQQDCQHYTQDLQAQEHIHLLGPTGHPDSSDSAWLLHTQQQQQQGLQRSRFSGGGSSSSSRWKKVREVAWSVTTQLGSPPMVGCMLAVAVGLIRPARDQLFAPEGKLLMIQVRGGLQQRCCS